MELVLFRQGKPVHRIAIPEGGLSVGRGGDNQLELSEDSISRRHAHLFLFEGRLWMRDLGSANGTYVNAVRLDGAAPIGDRDRLRFGRVLEARVHGAPAVAEDAERTEDAVVVEDVWSLVRHTLTPGRWCVLADGRIEPAGAEANLQVEPGGHCTVLQSRAWTPLEVDQQVVLAGRGLRRAAAGVGQLATVGSGEDRGFNYTLHCDLNAPSGAAAWLSHAEGERRRVCGGNGAVLLYQLGAALLRDRQQELPEVQVGWCDDDRLGRGVWGRSWATHDPNGLHVLLYRVRKAVSRTGLDPACIEKERGMTRIHVQNVEGTA